MNSATRELIFSTGTDNWATPDNLFDEYDQEFGFTLDAAADESNHKVDRWFGPGGEHEDALAVENWGGDDPEIAWLNPPYSRPLQGRLIGKAAEQAKRFGHVVVLLLPARTDTRMFHDYVWDREHHKPHEGVEVRFLKGRVKFKRAGGANIRTSPRHKGKPATNDAAPFPSMVVVFWP